jgi:nucleotide-binding universal stress UspA family protein
MYERIVVGTDGSDRSLVAVEHAAQLAERCGSELHVVQGCGTPILVSPYGGDTTGVHLPDLMAAVAESLVPLQRQLESRGLTVHAHVLPEGGADAVLDLAQSIEADLIVVGSRGMTGIRRVLGSVGSTVAHHAHCAVLIVPTE